jgi:protein-S-isoprenylcysteine O-methyltransferase Ste14
MLSIPGMTALAALFLWLAFFLLGTAQTASGTGRRVWLFGAACGRDRLAALGFRAAFVLAVASPLLWLAIPMLHKADPLWVEDRALLSAMMGAALACLGAALALLAQWTMGVSWRVGVQADETGALVSGGLFRVSRNPTFLGQAMLLIGVALAVPSLPTAIAPLLFLWSAHVQIRSEEAVLLATHGRAYADYMARTPRWIGLRKGRP